MADDREYSPLAPGAVQQADAQSRFIDPVRESGAVKPVGPYGAGAAGTR